MAAQPRPNLIQRIEGLPIMLVFVLLLLFFMWQAPAAFLAPNMYTTFLTTLPPLILLALGLTFVIGAGEIDLSFPSVIAFSGFVFAVLFKEYGLGWLAVLAAVAAGMFVGLINGLLIAKVGIPSFIATLGTQFFWTGMAAVLSGGKSYALRGAEGSSVWQVIVGRPFAEPGKFDWPNQIAVSPLWTAAICVLLWFILNRHRFGEHVLFIGDSNAVSRVVGINVAREKVKLFVMMGTLASLAAVILTLENKNFFGNQGQGYLLTAIAAVLIGGTSIFGGKATIVGTVFGCFVMIIMQPGLVAMGLTGSLVLTVQGLVFLVAIIFYLFVDEPQRRAAFFARFGRISSPRELIRPRSAGETPSIKGGRLSKEGRN
jgi:simple sugar transport system permease protein